MHLSINKKKIYFYIISFVFLSTIFNSNLISRFENLSKIKNIQIIGLDLDEQRKIKNELEAIKNKNIFTLKKDEIAEGIYKFNFINYFTINKIFPSEIRIFVKKADLLGITFINGEKFYIGSNKKFINISDVNYIENLPIIFGKFPLDEYLTLQKKLKNQNFDLSTIKKYYYFQSKRWDLEFEDGIKLKLPFKKVEESLRVFKILRENDKINSFSNMDLRLVNRIILLDEQK